MIIFSLFKKWLPAALLALEVTLDISFKQPSSQHYEQTALKGICCVGSISGDAHVTNPLLHG